MNKKDKRKDAKEAAQAHLDQAGSAQMTSFIPGMDQSDAPERMIMENTKDRQREKFEVDRSGLRIDRDAYKFGEVEGFR